MEKIGYKGSKGREIVFTALVLGLALLLSACATQEIETESQAVAEIEGPAASVIHQAVIGEKANLGGLEILVSEPEEGRYSLKMVKTTDTGESFVRSLETVEKTYEKIYVEVLNPTAQDIVFDSVKLRDDLGKEYGVEPNPDPSVELQEFGRDKIVSPSTLRKGYLFFLDVAEGAKTLELVFELESGERSVFKLRR
ncbi:MAG TPA: hypothetical protein VJB08_05015 [Candidatus Nanoarchaeia archaeon]|nr:hypothetical protein [Candidatus Nanoarchaeia archaeon]